ncbi:MAG TPA: type II toxin-antitoxin system HicA family toxin [Dehalococcoidia bacterium]|nr:type II toxin-antitoxin system HicA family toxin [Dehalococcoidia bacterium]
MSPRLRRLSADEVISALRHFGFDIVSQRGSHIKLKRASNEAITVPNHKELDRGTAATIFRQATRYIDEAELRPWFYTD